MSALAELGYAEATPVQTQAIPLALAGGDLVAAAQTGSGKTAAFALPMLERLSRSETAARSTRALVLVPTRELAAQVGVAFERYGKRLPRRPQTVVVYGGVGYQPQIQAASRGAEIVVATPGRLLDLVERGALDLSRVEMLALDEADRMLALGFADELKAVLALLPIERQTLLFSATFPPAVVAMADSMLREPSKVQMEAALLPVASIEQRAIEVERDSRTALLRHLLETEKWDRVLVFVGKRLRADNVMAKLAKYGVKATALHGDMGQEQRTRALEDFKKRKVQVLMATDVAARGLDIVDLPCVVNYDLPRSAADYLHRIGRTGRAGAAGVAVSFVTDEEDAHFRLIEKKHGLSIARERIEGFAPADWNPVSPSVGKAPVKGKRKSKKDKQREAAARVPGEMAAESVAGPWAQALRKARSGGSEGAGEG